MLLIGLRDIGEVGLDSKCNISGYIKRRFQAGVNHKQERFALQRAYTVVESSSVWTL